MNTRCCIILALILSATTKFACKAQAPLDTVTVYSFSTRELHSSVIPPTVFKMTNLRRLTINGMDCDANLVNEWGDTTCWALKAIPTDISKLRNLEILKLRVNSIQRVPIEIKALTKLKTLDLSDNPGLEEIENVVETQNLEQLILYGCYLTKLPASIARLKKLRLLALTGNNIEADEVERLRKKKFAEL